MGWREKVDGFVYVGRFGGEVGKINVDDSGSMANFWGHRIGHLKEAEILVIPSLGDA